MRSLGSIIAVVSSSLALAIALAIVPAAAGGSESIEAQEPRVIAPWARQIASANFYASRRRGTVGYVVLNHRGIAVGGFNSHRVFASASVFKSMLLVCYLNDPRVRSRTLTQRERVDLSAMITRSADGPANWLYGRVDHRCLYRLARAVDMRGFQTESIWGRTRITPYGTAKLFFRIDQRIVARHRAQAMRWLRAVVPAQRWGLARTVPSGMAIAFKGGFAGSPGGGRTVSQGALFSAPNGHRLGIAVLTNHSPSQTYGEVTIEGIGRRLLTGYVPVPLS